MNKVYLNKMKGTNYKKVGFTNNLERRKREYITGNPLIEFVEYANTYSKTKHELERECQKEIEEMGGKFVINHGIKTEWFELEGDFSLADLKCCKRRKIHSFEEVAQTSSFYC